MGPNPNPNVMHIFEGEYFGICRKMLMCFGLWPYGNKSTIYFLRFIALTLFFVASVCQALVVTIHTDDVDKQMKGILCFLAFWGMILKMVGMILADENMKDLHGRIADNWHLIEDKAEKDILHEYAKRARTGINYYVGLMGSAGFWCLLPWVAKVIDKMFPLENPRPDLLLIEGEYFFDKSKHFTLITCINYFWISYVAFLCAAFESMFAACSEHCCSLYAIIRYRLSMMTQEMQKSSSTTQNDCFYDSLRRTVLFHQHTLRFTSLLADSYSMALLFLLGIGVIIFPAACCAIIANPDNILHAVPYGMLSLAVIVQCFFFCYPGQRIIDHQLILSNAAFYNDWQEMSLRTKRLLLIFMLRCSKPVAITAGGLLSMNFELYFKFTKTAVSYVTVAASFR